MDKIKLRAYVVSLVNDAQVDYKIRARDHGYDQVTNALYDAYTKLNLLLDRIDSRDFD